MTNLKGSGNGKHGFWGDKMIPVRNIYHMLSYAWEGTLRQEGESFLDQEAFENIFNLLTAVLIQGVSRLIKSGFVKGYLEYSEELPLVRGKIQLNDTIKCQSFTRKRLVCLYDEFSENILVNRILKSTMQKMLYCPDLDKKYKEQCIVLLRTFSNVAEVDLGNVWWSRIAYSRLNKNYRLLLNISELIQSGLITTEEKGRYKFATFIKDKAMARLYEKFILNFYKKELKDGKAYSSIIDWKLDEEPGENLLPVMKTDIVVEREDGKLIIDTKYYRNALTQSNLGETKTIISSHLYQIYAYVKNSNEGKVSGMLLYPTVDYDLIQSYRMGGNNIHINTINLGESFVAIKDNLIRIAYSCM